MNADKGGRISVVACPACYNAYAVRPDVAGRVLRCGSCRAYFLADLATPAGEVADALILADPYIYHDDFYRGGCAELAGNVAELLALAGQPVTPRNVLEVVESLPKSAEEARPDHCRGHLFALLMREGHRRRPESPRLAALGGYFLEYLPGRRPEALDALRNSFEGVLSIPFEAPAEIIPGAAPPPPVAPAGPYRYARRLMRVLLGARDECKRDPRGD